MAITRIKNSSIANRTPKYNDFLAGLPFRPVIGTATDGGTGTTVSVAFTGNNPAGAGITYTALSSPGSITATGPASPITVTGLTAGTAYTFQVKAGNSLGDSAYSGSSNSVTPVTPTAFESIASATGTGSANTITFSNIPTTYQHLQIRGVMKNTFTSNNTSIGSVWITAMSIGAGNYARHILWGDASAGFGASGGSSGDYIDTYAGVASNNTDRVDNVGAIIIDIHDYASTSKLKVFRIFAGCDYNSTSAGSIELTSGMILTSGSSALTSITLQTSSTNWNTKTQFALYGIKGS